jgi:hypothetical protein
MQRWRLAVLISLCIPIVASYGLRAATCTPEGKITFICGVTSPEDLVAIPGTDWIVASGFEGGGALHIVNARDGQTVRVFPTAAPRLRPDKRAYPACPGPLDPAEKEKFSAHGVNVRPGRNGIHTLYVVHHGFRESIEVFEVDGRSPSTFTWIGCVVAPEHVEFNSVAPLPDEGLVATNPYGRDPEARVRAPRGINTGQVWEWHTASGWKAIPGTESPGPNGIEVSKDGKWLYVNLWPVRKVMRFSRGQMPVKQDVLDVPFHPDNIRWQPDGSLFSAGHHGPPPIERTRECLRKNCPDAAARVVRIDPQKFTFQQIVDYPSNDVFFGATAALQVGREIWIGSVRGDRIARVPVQGN